MSGMFLRHSVVSAETETLYSAPYRNRNNTETAFAVRFGTKTETEPKPDFGRSLGRLLRCIQNTPDDMLCLLGFPLQPHYNAFLIFHGKVTRCPSHFSVCLSRIGQPPI